MLNIFFDGIQFVDIYIRKLIHRPAKKPLAVYLELTKRCNYKCKFCDLWKLKPQKEFTFAQLKIFLTQCEEAGVKLLHVEGGEATLLPFFPEFVKEASERKIHLSLTTNGSTMNPAYTKKLVQAGLKTVAISIDSHIPEIHDASRGVRGAFEKTVANIMAIKNNHPGLKLWINHIVHRQNFKDLKKFIDFCIGLKLDTIYLLPIHNLPPIKDNAPPCEDLFFSDISETDQLRGEMVTIINYMKQKRVNTLSDPFYHYIADSYHDSLPRGYCDAGKLVCEIDCSGNVYLCLPLKKIIGNIHNDTLKNIWRSPEAGKVRRTLTNCNHCWYNCHIEPAIRFKASYFLLNPLKMLKDYRMHLG